MEHPEIQRIFKKYLQSTCTEQELKMLFEYFEAEQDSELKEGLLSYFEERDEVSGDSLSNEALEIAGSIRPIVMSHVNRTKSGDRTLQKWIIAAAATLIAISVSIWVYNYRTKLTPQSELVSNNGDDIFPGGNRATLKIGNSDAIKLDEIRTEIIIGDSITYEDGTGIASGANNEYAVLSTPRAGQYKITLPDGTKVSLNAESSLRYPLRFDEKARKVQVTGEAFFEIEQDKDQPFIVESKGQTLTVLGTSFNINSYTHDVVTTLVSGKVKVATGQSRPEILSPGDQAVLNDNSFSIKQVDINDAVAWTTGFIVLNNASLSDVIEQVERWYDVEFEIKTRPQATAYVALNRESKLSEVLEALEINYGTKFRIEGRRVIETE